MQPIRLFAIVLFLCGGLVAAETAQPLTLEQLEAIAIQPARNYEATNSRVVPEMLPLFKAEKIVYTGKNRYKNTEIGFRLHVPENLEPGKKYPLILWLHGVGEAGTDNKDQLVHLHHIITYLTGPKKRDFFLLVPQTPNNHTSWDAHTSYVYNTVAVEGEQPQQSASSLLGSLFGGATQARQVARQEPVEVESEPFADSPLGFSFAMLDQVVANYPVDTNRITVSGLSSGGDGTWRALERRPGLFAAAVPLVSWNALKDNAIEKNPILKKVPIWAIYSSDDNGIDFARQEFERLEKAGCNVMKSEFGVCGHNAWTPAMLQADIFSWLLSRAKNDGEYIAVFDANVNPEDMKGVIEVAQVPAGIPTLAPDVVDVGPQPAAVVTRQLTADDRNVDRPMSEVGTLVPAPPRVDGGPQTADRFFALQRQEGESVVRQPNHEQVQTPYVPTPPHSVTMAHEFPVYPVPHPVAVNPEIQAAKDMLYSQLADKYFGEDDIESFKRVVGKLSSQGKIMALTRVLMEYQLSTEQLSVIEALIDQIAEPLRVLVPGVDFPVLTPAEVEFSLPREGSLPGSKIVEECDREWAMTSGSLYGMFPADWDKEGKQIPDFVLKSTAEELIRLLRDPEMLQLAAESVLALEHRPMSSPWFETNGGRLRSDIQYTLSAKGRVLVVLLKVSKQPYAERTLRKIDTILSNEK